MLRHAFTMAACAAFFAATPSLACRMMAPLDLADVKYADVVVVGRVSNYTVVLDQKIREQNKALFDQGQAPGAYISDYVRFDIEVQEVLAGKAPSRLTVTWDASTFGEPANLPPGPFLIALRDPHSATPPLRGPSATILPNPEPLSLTVLNPPCARAFIFPAESTTAEEIRRRLQR